MNFNIEKILDKFTTAQRIWALIIIGLIIIVLSAINIFPDVVSKVTAFISHKTCRSDIHECNKEYNELSKVIREYIRAENLSKGFDTLQESSDIVEFNEDLEEFQMKSSYKKGNFNTKKDSLLQVMNQLSIEN